MAITQAQLEKRKSYLGSSDVATVMGVNSYSNPYELYLEKTGKLEPREPNEAMLWGTLMEPIILQKAQESLGKLMTAPDALEFIVKGFPIMSHPDALTILEGEPVEGKTSGLISPVHLKWGDAETDEVPDMVIVQCHVHMLAMDKEICHVPAFLGGRGFVMYHVPFHKDLADNIVEKCCDFWECCVVRDIPPDDSMAPSIEVLKRVRRVPEKIVDVPDALVLSWQSANETRLDAEKTEKAAKETLITALGDAEGGNCGQGLVTFFETQRKGYEVKPTKFRTLRLKE